MNIKTAIISFASTSMRSSRVRGYGLAAIAVIILLTSALLLSSRLGGLPDMRAIEDVNTRKATFFEYLTPIVESLNEEILVQRNRLQAIADDFRDDRRLSLFNKHRLKSLAREYDLEWDSSDPGENIRALQRRVDMVPVPLVLVQAAKESGWGTSRFAREGNNLFGQWCYSAGCGIVPSRRAGGAKHEVRAFDSVEDAISAYLYNINSGDAYRSLREIRARLRNAGKTPDAMSLADGLLYYSQRREAYVSEVKLMLEQYRKFQQQLQE